MTDATFLTPELMGIIATLLSFAIGILLRQPAFQKAKIKISTSRQFLTEIDDALYDNKVTEEEFRKIFDAGKKIIDKGDGL